MLVDARRVAALATAVGLALGAMGMDALASRLPGLQGSAWPLLAGVAALMSALALAAGWWPARRASRADPMTVLRQGELIELRLPVEEIPGLDRFDPVSDDDESAAPDDDED